MAANTEALRQTEEIPEWKQAEVEEISTFLERYESVGVVNITGIPSRQLQAMRRDLHGAAELRVSRNTLLARSLDDVDEGLEELQAYISGQVGLIGTNDNPFGLFRQLEASKTPAPINAGEVAPNDIVIDAGDTGIDPGPFVGELQQVGAEARIQEGSIRVTEDSVVAEAGDVVSEQLAGVLAELEIEPKEVGLNLRAVFSDGILFEADELELDIDAYRSDVQSGIGSAHALSLSTGFPTAATIGSLLSKAHQSGQAVGMAAAIEDPAILPSLFQQADAQLRAIASRIDDEDALPPELQAIEPAPAESGAEPEPDDTDEPPEEPTEAEDEQDDEEDGDGAEGLGELFG